MSTTYQDIGTALYAFMDALDISSIVATGWAAKYNYPPKQLTVYPAFTVVPAEDEETDLDTFNDQDRVSYWVYLHDTYEDAAGAESRLRQLVDLVRTELRKERRQAQPLNSADYSLQIKGVWGADIEHGERWYRLQVDVASMQPLT